MHPTPSYPHPVIGHNAVGGLLRRWLTRSARTWQQRKMIAALNAMDNWMLRDIGIERSDIERIVKGFDAHELRMTPLAPPKPSI
ncbi:DUF1127 domain-containing protein [Pseudorhodobacter aquimaris]|uniref:DUF1127 domain-containing protein n=1 Tax=Pseudorhodobacter aquimaris TaxID=687412 RepID=UPI0018DC5228|nr:DUF1127 domain-containing protein [Pseudorhodobacter aquimaris]